MASEKHPRYLIGSGEKLTSETLYPRRKQPPKVWPYQIAEAVQLLKPKVSRTARSLRALPKEARPNGEAVALVTLHPQALAKSWFPSALFEGVGLRAVGCRARTVVPKKIVESKKSTNRPPGEHETIELYLAGTVDRFEEWSKRMEHWPTAERGGTKEIVRIEDVRPLSDIDHEGRISFGPSKAQTLVLEAALHDEEGSAVDMLQLFVHYAKHIGIETWPELCVEVPGIVFMPVRADRDALRELSKFGFLRSLHPIPKLRSLPPAGVTRSMGMPVAVKQLPPLNPAIRVAVLDGGLPPTHGIASVKHFDTPGVGPFHQPYTDHGTAVTGALLWGIIDPAGVTARPYSSVDHFRVLDANDARSTDVNIYHVLRRVKDVVETGSHDIFSLSLGPDLAVDDADVHSWTSTLDTLCADGTKLLVVAAGNNGTMPYPLCRIQSPSDGVNCLSVGAIDSRGTDWKRAPYSATGPGRRPGVVKPDLVAFGGHHGEPFKVLRIRGSSFVLADDMGTSFATPLVTRSATALRSFFSSNLQPLTLKCLLIHSAENGTHDVKEVGWGKVADETELFECPDSSARVIYQGTLPPKKLLRAKLPIPPELKGFVTISATICYATEISAADPLNYTNSGVEITYRPNSKKAKIDKKTGELGSYAKPTTFFSGGGYASEEEKRTRERKWETVLHASRRVNAKLLHEPCLDMHFIPRVGAMDNPQAQKIRYSMVITVSSPKYPDLYTRVLNAFPQLQVLTPVTLPVRV